MTATHNRSRSIVLGLCLILISTAVFAPVAAASTADSSESEMVVEVDAEGNAEIILTLTYNLESDDASDAFETLQEDANTRDEIRDRFESRMNQVADDASTAADRSMWVDGATVDVRTSDDGKVGVVTLTITWHSLATVDNDHLVITEPFSSGFVTDRTLTVVAPSGYEIESTTPTATISEDNEAVWGAGDTLEGFELVMVADGTTGTDDDTASDDAVPGFGIGLGIAGLGFAAYLLRRH